MIDLQIVETLTFRRNLKADKDKAREVLRVFPNKDIVNFTKMSAPHVSQLKKGTVKMQPSSERLLALCYDNVIQQLEEQASWEKAKH